MKAQTYLIMLAILFWQLISNLFAQTPPTKEWDKDFGGTNTDFFTTTIQSNDGGYLLGGHIQSDQSGDISQVSFGLADFWILKTDVNGIKLWDARFGGNGQDALWCIQQTSDGGYILGGYSQSGISGDKTQANQGDWDYWIVKTDANGIKQWDATFGTSALDQLYSVQQTNDGGYILGGWSASGINGDKTQVNKGGFDYWIVKTDASGVKQWDASFGGSADDHLRSLRQTSDGGYILGGCSYSGISGDKTQSTQGSSDYWIVKTDASGVKQWDASFGGGADDGNFGAGFIQFCIQQTDDGGYIFGGPSRSGISSDKTQACQGGSDYWIVKANSSGVKQWDATFGGNSDDDLAYLQETVDGGYILSGWSSSDISGDKTQESKGAADIWLVKANSLGQKQWDVTLGGNSNEFSYQQTLQQTSDGGFITGAESYSGISGDKTQGTQGLSDYWIVKLTCEAPQTFYADGDGDSYGNPLVTILTCTTPSGYVSDNTDCNDANAAINLPQTYFADADGDGFGNANSTTLACTAPSGYVSNNTDCDDNNSAINPNGLPTKQWDARFGGTSTDRPSYVQQTSDGGYIIGGLSKSAISGDKTQANWDGSNATFDYWVVKTDANGVKQWDKRFGGTGNDSLLVVFQTIDGGYILGGFSNSGISGDKTQASKGLYDYWIVKTDANGNKLWDASYGGSENDVLQAMQKTIDGGYILGGYSSSGISGDKTQASQGGRDYWIIKTNANGVKQWDKRFGGSANDGLYSLQQTSDGYILGGRSLSGIGGDKTQANWDGTNSTYDYWIVKTDANGVKQWDKRFGTTTNDYGYAVRQSTDGGYLLGGYCNSGISGDKSQAGQGNNDYWVVKTDASGNKIWDARYGGSNDDQMYVIRSAAGGGYLLGGRSKSPISGDKSQASQGDHDFWIVKIDNNGVKQWDKRYGGSQADVITGLDQAADGGYIIGGYSFSGISGDKTQSNWDATLATTDYWLVKISNGTGQLPFYADADGDGYGNVSVVTAACSAPSGYVSDHADCNDASAAIHPNAADLCNSIDDNCNGVIDENTIIATVTPTGTVSVCSGTSVILTANSGAGISYQWKKGSSNIAGATNSTYSTTKAAGYKVTETNTFGCSSTSAVTTVSVVSLPAATITPLGNLDICATGSVVLQANAGAGITYQWVKGNANVPGATTQNYTATKAATYKVIVTNSSSCNKTSVGTKVTKSCKEGEMDEAITSQLSIYPNPTDGNFIIELATGEKENETVTIEVMNSLGQIVHSEITAVINGELQKEISFNRSMTEGMYLVKVVMKNKVFTRQVVYQK